MIWPSMLGKLREAVDLNVALAGPKPFDHRRNQLKRRVKEPSA